MFMAPPRPVLKAKTYTEAKTICQSLCGQSMSRQAFGIMPKIAEVDIWMRAQKRREPRVQDRVFEVHPELCFRALNGGEPVTESKHSAAGLDRRYALLQDHFGSRNLRSWVRAFLRGKPGSKVKEDDVVDAAVACVTTATWAPGATIPRARPPVDAEGLRMEMRCPALKRERQMG